MIVCSGAGWGEDMKVTAVLVVRPLPLLARARLRDMGKYLGKICKMRG